MSAEGKKNNKFAKNGINKRKHKWNLKLKMKYDELSKRRTQLKGLTTGFLYSKNKNFPLCFFSLSPSWFERQVVLCLFPTKVKCKLSTNIDTQNANG